MTDEFITLRGLPEVQKALYSYSQQLGDKVVLAALRQGANLVKKNIQSQAPVKSGKLKIKGFKVSLSKIYSKRKSSNKLGIFLTLNAKKKDDPYYGRFQNDGWTTKGKSANKSQRGQITQEFGKRTGRKTLSGKTKVAGKHFIQQGFAQSKTQATELIIATAQAGADVIAKRLGIGG